MGFLSGRITFERFRVSGAGVSQFSSEHIETLERWQVERSGPRPVDDAHVGFLAGEHLFDQQFSLEKNVINDALHCGIRVDTDQIPSAIKKAWLQMELSAMLAESDSERPTKAQRQEAKEAVEARCEEEARTGKFRRMQQFPVLWDARHEMLYLGTSSGTAAEHCRNLFAKAFDIELTRVTAGRLAEQWASENKKSAALEEATPAVFLPHDPRPDIAWVEPGNFDFLGNELLLWLWWYLETQSDTFTLDDDSQLTAMLTRTLTLECPHGESGKETISADAPVQLPEARQAIRTGKLPRKSGMILVRFATQYELALQPEMMTVGGARIQSEDEGSDRGVLADRIDSLREMSETLDQLFISFYKRRLGKKWDADVENIRRWLLEDAAEAEKSAA